MKNIIHFPKDRIVRESPQLEEEALEFIKEHKKKSYVDELLLNLSENIVLTLDHNGIPIESKEFERDFNYTMDVLRAAIYRQMHMSHPLHQWIHDNLEPRKRVELKPED